MAQYSDSSEKSFLPGSTAIPAYSRVKVTATGCDLAGAEDATLGSAAAPGYAVDANGYQGVMPVKLWNANGTHLAIASAAISAGAEIQGAASGEIAPLAAGKAIGRAVGAASGDGSVIEVFYYPPEAAGDELESYTDPGDAAAIAPTGNLYVDLVTAGAETRTLSDPTAVGQNVTLSMKTDGGNCVVTAATQINQATNTVMTFADVGDTISLVSISDGASNFKWSVVGNDGVALS